MSDHPTPTLGPGALAAAVAALAFNLTLLLVHAFKIPQLRYHPVERVWDVSAMAGPLPMLLYGQLLWAVLAAGLAGGLVLLVVRRPPSTRAVMYAVGWLLLSCVIDLSYYAHANWP